MSRVQVSRSSAETRVMPAGSDCFIYDDDQLSIPGNTGPALARRGQQPQPWSNRPTYLQQLLAQALAFEADTRHVETL